MASNTPPKIEVENCDENNTDKIEVLPSPTDDQNHDSALIGVSNDSTDAQASTSGRASPKLTLAIERPQPARTARHMEVIRIEERHGVFYNAIPALPLVPAAVFCVLNVVAPGVGTLLSAFTVFCGGTTRLSKPIFAFGYNILAAILQMALSLLIVGWIWSILWGMTFIQLSRGRRIPNSPQSPTLPLYMRRQTSHDPH